MSKEAKELLKKAMSNCWTCYVRDDLTSTPCFRSPATKKIYQVIEQAISLLEAEPPEAGELSKKLRKEVSSGGWSQAEVNEHVLTVIEACDRLDRQAEEIKRLTTTCKCCGKQTNEPVHSCNFSKCAIVQEQQKRIAELEGEQEWNC